MDAEPIEQLSATEPMSQQDPIEQFGEPSRTDAASTTAGLVIPIARFLAGVEPECERRRAKQQRRLYDDDTSQGALEVRAFRAVSERMGIGPGRLRSRFPSASDDELRGSWRRQLAGEDVDEDGLPRPLTLVGGVDEEQAKHVDRIADYLRCITNDRTSKFHEKSLDCTFCGMLFPPHYLLAGNETNPDNVDDWRNCHYRCCYQCVTGNSEDYIWYSECSSLSPAILAKAGNFEENDTTTSTAPRTTKTSPRDGTSQSSKATLGVPRCASSPSGTRHDTAKCRWIRKPIFRHKSRKRLRLDRYRRLVQDLPESSHDPPQHLRRRTPAAIFELEDDVRRCG